MKQLKLFTAILLAVFMFTACDDVDDSISSPVFEGINLNPSIVHPGDTVTLTLNIKDKGKNAYIWRTTFKCQNNNDEKDVNTYELDKSTSAFSLITPTYQFKAPNVPGVYTITITPDISYIAGNKLYDKGPDLSARLEVVDNGGSSADDDNSGEY